MPIPSWQSIAALLCIAIIARLIALGFRRHAWFAGPGGRAHFDKSGMRSVFVAGLCALALVLLTAALFGGLLDAVDANIRAWVQVLQDDAFVRLCLFITSLGNAEVLLAVAIVSAGLFWAFGQHGDTRGLLVSVIGSQATTYFLKYAVGRERPEFESFASAITPSFPSAHTTGAVAVYGFVIAVVAHRLSRRAHFEVVFWGASFVLLLAATRVFLGVHYFSDVVAGLLVGTFWLVAGRAASAH